MSVHNLTKCLSTRIIDNQAISLEVLNTNFSLRFLGSTIPANVDVIKVGEQGVTQIVFYPKPDEEGLIALCVRILCGQNAEYVPAFFRVVWKEKDGAKYPFIYLDESWVMSERIGHAKPSSIEIVIKGKRFSSFESNGKNAPIYVPDGNLLCRYMWGTASALDVLHAAVQKKVEPIAAKRIEQLSREVWTVTQERNRMEQDLSSSVRISRGYSHHFADLREAVEPICKMFGRLPIWMQPKSVRNLIKVANNGK